MFSFEFEIFSFRGKINQSSLFFDKLSTINYRSWNHPSQPHRSSSLCLKSICRTRQFDSSKPFRDYYPELQKSTVLLYLAKPTFISITIKHNVNKLIQIVVNLKPSDVLVQRVEVKESYSFQIFRVQ